MPTSTRDIMSNSQINSSEINQIDVESVFKAKSPALYKAAPKCFINYLKRIIHQDDINQFLIDCKDLKGLAFAKAILKKFGAYITIEGLENVPDEGRYIFASNHPLGGLDGMLFIDAVGQKYSDIKFPVNDILLYLNGFSDIFLPVNKIGTTGRHAAQLMEDAFASDSQILMFPAGLCSRKINGRITDLEWKKGFVTKAIATQRDIIPVLISGKNSNFFYNLSNIRKLLGIKINIEMLYLVDEMYKQYNRDLTITFGKPIQWQTLKQQSPYKMAQQIKEITYNLAPKSIIIR